MLTLFRAGNPSDGDPVALSLSQTCSVLLVAVVF